MFGTILVPTDGSSDATKGARRGIDLAAQLGATVHGRFVVEEGGNARESTSMAEQDERAEAYGMQVLSETGGLFGSTADEVLRTVHVPVVIRRRELRESSAADARPAAAQ